MILEKISFSMTHVKQMDTKSNMNSQVQEPPQRNGKVEQKFQTFYGRSRVTLNNEGLEDSIRTGVWAE
jgi:hypothetical protein